LKQAAENASRAILCSNEEAADRIQTLLGSSGAESATRWYTPGNLHDLDRAVRDGRVRHVYLANLSDLLAGIWEHEIDFDAWIEREVQIEITEPATLSPGPQKLDSRIAGATAPQIVGTPAPQMTGREALDIARAVHKSWQEWRARYRKRSLLTAGVITALVLALCFVVNLVIGR
jgi:hypothetical protein